jgi:hypothetical protein
MLKKDPSVHQLVLQPLACYHHHLTREVLTYNLPQSISSKAKRTKALLQNSFTIGAPLCSNVSSTNVNGLAPSLRFNSFWKSRVLCVLLCCRGLGAIFRQSFYCMTRIRISLFPEGRIVWLPGAERKVERFLNGGGGVVFPFRKSNPNTMTRLSLRNLP